MKSSKIKVKLPILEECNLTADDWDLFTNAMNCDEAAEALNKAVIQAINGKHTREEARAIISKVQEKYAKFGASDSEPNYVVIDILNNAYGEEDV